MALQYSYQGKQQSQNKNESRYKETLYGSKAECEAYRDSLAIGANVQGKGYLQSWRITQKEADIWQIEVEYSVTYDLTFSNEEQALIGKKSAQLSVRTIQMPLQAKSNSYLANWNYYLITDIMSSNSNAPAWWNTAKDTFLTPGQGLHYKWVKTLAEIPQGFSDSSNSAYWHQLKAPTKPGVEYYDMAYFVVTITAKYNSATQAGQAISKRINSIITPPEDFGLGGQWKYDDASVHYDGRLWIATETYTRAGDEKGWDKDLYSVYQSGTNHGLDV